MKSLPKRLASFAANRDELAEKIEGVPGIKLAHNYPKSAGSELYGGLRFLYDAGALGGLTAEKLCEALKAEGVPMTAGGFRAPEHLRAIYTKDLSGLWGKDHPGPANVPLPRYARGDFPVAEGLDGRILSMTGWFEAAEGLIDQVASAIRKVAEGHKALL